MIRHLTATLLAILIAAPLLAADTGTIRFVESVPLETELDLPQLPQTAPVWTELVESATRSLDLFAFYVSPDEEGRGALAGILDLVETRAEQGVAVRLLSDARFYRTYPGTHDRFVAAGIPARTIDGTAAWGAGVHHAKGMIVDETRFFLGSQNWDWRALDHIHELGAVVEHPAMAADLARIFAIDWALAGDETPPPLAADVSDEPVFAPVRALTTADGAICEAVLAASPPHALPEGVPWDLPLLIDQIDRASERVRLQMLSYNPGDRDGGYWSELDQALRRAAARGCTVEIILANWAKRGYMVPHIKSLAVMPRIEVRFTNIPEWSGGFIPFARVDHAKFVTCDGDALWLGTANGSRDYFHQSRNISLFLRGEGCTAAADAFFTISWHSVYAETVDPGAEYEPPRRQ
jgi:phosphatidylserine/phosphatidylglycerophosphate/cardiolipin synthase-like enzyme